MKGIVRLAPPLLLLGCIVTTGAWAAPGRTVQRPISDFLENQSISWSSLWSTPVIDQTARWAYMDYTGLMAQNLKDHAGIDLHTAFDGIVHERPLPGGGAEVTVQLRVRNAFTNVQTIQFDENGNPNWSSIITTMGVTWGEVLNHYGLPWNEPPDLEGTLEPYDFPFALGDCRLRWVYTTPTFGAAIPDMGVALWSGTMPEITTLMAQFEGTATGPLWAASGLGPDGSPGKVKILQLYLPKTGSDNLPGHDGWPAEIVNLRRIGH